jgi:hypothetical protein
MSELLMLLKLIVIYSQLIITENIKLVTCTEVKYLSLNQNHQKILILKRGRL